MRWVIAFFACLWGQITIQSSDLPSPGSIYPFGQARPNSALDYAATGAGYTWNFSGLRADTHLLSEWKSISSVPQYSFSCGNWQAWQSLLLKIADSIPTPPWCFQKCLRFPKQNDQPPTHRGSGCYPQRPALDFLLFRPR